MRNVYVICEGQTEANFVKKVLVPVFYSRINLIPRIVETSFDRRLGRSHKGGMVSYAQAYKTIKITLNDALKKQSSIVTTMFDFYALPTDMPGYNSLSVMSTPYQKVSAVETAMLNAVPSPCQALYHPYIQLHEFEALVFCNLSGLQQKYFNCNIAPLQQCLQLQKNPELINGGSTTAPSKRILSCVPSYDKVDVGVSVVGEVGLTVLCAQCPHFNDWIAFLNTL